MENFDKEMIKRILVPQTFHFTLDELTDMVDCGTSLSEDEKDLDFLEYCLDLITKCINENKNEIDITI